ncbi:MAG: response regulator [Elusimicrobiota bacterium]
MTPAGSAEAKDKLILIVDDDDGQQEFISLALRTEGFRIEQAFDGREALRKVRQLLPDLILLDLMFPRHGGHEITVQLQSEPTADIPIIIISGYSKDHLTKAMICEEPNVVDFMSKPLRADRLIPKIHEILDTRPSKRAKRPART